MKVLQSRLPILAFTLLVSLPALAQNEFLQPEIYKLTGVSAGGALNVRAGPSTGTADIGDLPSGATIEILELDTRKDWGRILFKEGNGWVAMGYLEPATTATIRESALPEGLLCSGAEPFWYLDMSTEEEITVSVLGSIEPLNTPLESIRRLIEWQPFPVALKAGAESARITAVIDNGSCTDGMTTREYGRVIEMILETDEVSVLTGCCYLPTPGGS